MELNEAGCSFTDFLRVVREDYRESFVNGFLINKEGITNSATFPVVTNTGTQWFYARYRVSGYKGHKPARLLGSLRPAPDPEKKNDEESRKDKEYLKRLYKYMPIGYQQTKLIYENGIPVDYVFLEINKKTEQISGKTRRKILSTRGSEQEFLFHEELRHMAEVVNTHKHVEYDYREVDTGIHCRAIMFSPQKDIVVTLLLDVTDTYRAHKELRQNERLLKNIFDNMPVGLEVFDKDGILIKANSKDVDILGMSSEEDYMGVNIFDHPILPLEVKDKIRRGEKIDFNSSYEYSRVPENYYKNPPVKKGSVNMTTKIVPVLDNQKQIQNILFINIDNTETTNAYLRIQEFEEYFSLIADYAKVGYFKWNLMTKEGFAISQWFKNLGKASDTLINENLEDIYSTLRPEDFGVINNFYKEAREGKARTLYKEMQISSKNALPRWLRCVLTVKEYDPANHNIELVGLSVDITELKMMLLAKDRAETSDKLKTAFLANMSHEIRTPLNAIVGFSDALCEEDDPGQRVEIAKVIHHNNDLLLKLISDIFDLSRIEANMLEFHKCEFEVKSFSKSIVHDMKERETEGLKILFDEDSPEIYMYGDMDRINQVIVKLIDNSLKFTTRGHVRFGYTMTDHNMVLFYVEDTGIGIPAEDLEKVFDRFVKLDSFVQGSGIGLSVSRNIVNQMGGEMGVESKPGEGSRFWFKVPMA